MLLGLVGKPSCGKSTFFKAATLAEVLIASYPFATIKPNTGMGFVKIDCIDTEFNVQCNPRVGRCVNHNRFVPVELMDVAGLVEGASEGKGLGNQFLDDLRQADVFMHIIDVSGTTDEEGKSTEDYNPVKDVDMLENELDLWYLGILNKVWKTFSRTLANNKEDLSFHEAVARQFSGLRINDGMVKDAIRKTGLDPVLASRWANEDLKKFARALRDISKPMVLIANKIDMPNGKKNYEMLKEKYPDRMIIPCSADSELALREASKAGLIEYIPGERDFKVLKDLNEKQKAALDSIKKNVLDVYEDGTGVQKVLNSAVFDLLKYIAIFPAGGKLADQYGNILPDCFLLPEGSTALDFAYSLHTDIGDAFIKAIDARTKRAVGKDYVLKHRDAMEIATR